MKTQGQVQRSKTKSRQATGWMPCAGAAAILFFACALVVQAQDCTVGWRAVDGGGGTSTGGVFSFSGTVGQPDAGAMSGGGFTLEGGFWGVFAVQMAGAPLLSIGCGPTNSVVVSWPGTSQGFVLQENADLKTTNWVNVATAPMVLDGRRQVCVPVPAARRFYRLMKP